MSEQAPAGPTVVQARRPDGTVVECVVQGRRRDPDGSWWYQLAPVPEPAVSGPPLQGWPPPAEDWRRQQMLGGGEPRFVVHRGGCWLYTEDRISAEEARALVASPNGEGCDVCEAEDGLRSLDV